jgi:hypothetical protein
VEGKVDLTWLSAEQWVCKALPSTPERFMFHFLKIIELDSKADGAEGSQDEQIRSRSSQFMSQDTSRRGF